MSYNIKASPTEPIEANKPASLSLLPNSTGVYWSPLSEWWTSPAEGVHRHRAMFSASTTRSALRWPDIDQPATVLAAAGVEYEGQVQSAGPGWERR